MVTVSTERIDFTTPIPQGTIIELVARVDKVGKSSCVVKTEIFMEDMYSYKREKVVTGFFTFVAVGNDKKPIPIV